ncbi:unnamed protein product [Rotaria socialis]
MASKSFLIFCIVAITLACFIETTGIMSRGCSWEYGFMTRQIPYTPIYEQESIWIFCDTTLCNAHANGSA